MDETSGRSLLDRVRSEPTWPLLPLRLFLGFTFLYAGLSKIADRTFLDDSSPLGMHANVIAVKGSSPIGGLLGPVVDHSFFFGLLMALGETAVGIGVLVGLFHRIAALGGVVLALSLWLTVSWNADPWYTSADIVYAFAMVPLLLAGPTPFSADVWLAQVKQRHPDVREDRTRRTVLAGGAALAGLVAVAGASLLRGSKSDEASDDPTVATPSTSGSGGTSASTTPTSPAGSTSAGSTGGSSAAPTGEVLVAASAVSVGGAKGLNDPKSGDPIFVLQLEAGQFTGLDATCPHQGCAVSFVSKSEGFVCPCHQSKFTSAGKVTKGPATKDLTSFEVVENAGQITKK